MGLLHYGGGEEPIQMPDRVLAHVKVVIATKLRRQESFLISWRHPDDPAAGRESIWVHPAIPLRFVFDTAANEEIDHALLQQFAVEASSTKGLCLELESTPAEGRERIELVA